MYYIGMNGNVGRESHDPAVALFKDGKLLYAIEEERINKIKHSPGKIPVNALEAALNYANIKLQDIEAIAFPQNSWGEIFENRLRNVITHSFGYCPSLLFYNHHLSHAASAYYSSNFSDERTLVYSIDGSGDSVSISAYIFEGAKNELVFKEKYPNSFGAFYSAFTQYLGFEKNNEEYKVMSLAAYGKPIYDMDSLITFTNGNISFNTKLYNKLIEKMKYPNYLTKQEPFYDENMLRQYCERRIKNEPIQKEHKDLAASMQFIFEKKNIELIMHLLITTNCSNLVVSGGSMLNCKFIGKMLKEVMPRKFFISPFSDDAGNSIGAGYLFSNKMGYKNIPLYSAYLGDEYLEDDIRKCLEINKIKYTYMKKPEDHIVTSLKHDKIVSIFSGRMEFGPRALGNRSILASIKTPNIVNKLNTLKKRYYFQPFAVAILEECVSEYFYNYGYLSPFMNIAFSAKEREETTNIIHIDNTVRLQTIGNEDSLLSRVLKLYVNEEKLPMVINTSFNKKGEPIVRTPEDALASFFSLPLDVLYLDNFVIEK